MLVLSLGLKKEAFELRLITRLGFTVDIFLIYKMNNTSEYQWNGYQGGKKLYRFHIKHNFVFFKFFVFLFIV